MLMGLGLLSAAVTMTAGAGPAAAFDYPYCIQGGEVGVPGDCSYPSYEACLASASGRNVYCNINPRVAFQRQQPPLRHGRQPYPDYDGRR
jgi:aspartate/methionine/tyrosine aminotransferase